MCCWNITVIAEQVMVADTIYVDGPSVCTLRVEETATRRSFIVSSNCIILHKQHNMALLVDKHRPRNLEALNYHPELSERLRALVRTTARYHAAAALTVHLTGTKRRFSSPSCVRTVWRRQEDAHCRDSQGALWAWCREDQNRRPRLPDHLKPQARIQHRRVRLSPRNHTLR